MSEIAYTPGIGNAPFGDKNTNAQGSFYAQESGYNAQESNLIKKDIKEAIFDAAPEQFNALKLLFQKTMEEVNSDEFEYLEYTFGRSALEANSVVAAQPAAAGVPQTQTIAFTAASISHMSPDLILVYPDNSKGVVKSITGNNVVIESQTSKGLPAVAVGDIFSIQSTIQADAMNYLSNYERLQTVTRYNYVQEFCRAWRWGRKELLKHKNNGTTDYLIKDKLEKMRQMRTDLFVSFFNGTRGEFSISNNYITKAMGGIFPTMVDAGSMTANPSLAGLKSAFAALAFATNHKKEGGVRFIYGTDEMLWNLSEVFKDPGLRYAPNDTISSMGLMEYRLGNMRFVPVTCELFKDQSCFPKEWNRKLLILDQESITPIKMRGLPSMDIGSTLARKDGGTRENFEDGYIEANLSVRFNNPVASFWLDVA